MISKPFRVSSFYRGVRVEVFNPVGQEMLTTVLAPKHARKLAAELLEEAYNAENASDESYDSSRRARAKR